MKRIIFLFFILLLTGLILVACGKEEASVPTEPSQEAPRPTAPQINLDADDAENVNNWLLKNYGKNFKGEVSWNVIPGKDTACALVICLTEKEGGTQHYVVNNFDGLTGEGISNEQILSQANLKESRFLSLARTAAAQQFYAANGLEKGAEYDRQLTERIEEKLGTTIAAERFSTQMPMFINQEGQLCIVTRIGSVTEEPENAQIIPVTVPETYPVYELYSPYTKEAVLVPQISSNSKAARKINDAIMKAYKDQDEAQTELHWTAGNWEDRLLSLVLYRTTEEETKILMVRNFDLDKEKEVGNEDLLEMLGTTGKDFAYLTKLAAEAHYLELWQPKKATQEISEERFLEGLTTILGKDYSSEIQQIFLDEEGRLKAATRMEDLLTGELAEVTLSVELQDVAVDPQTLITCPFSTNQLDADGKQWAFRIPQINGDSVDIRRVNKSIMDRYAPLAQTMIEGGDLAAINKDNLRKVLWNVEERSARQFALILTTENVQGSVYHEVYNFDRLTGKLVSNEELLAAAELTEEEFIALANDAIDLQFHIDYAGRECDPASEAYEFGLQKHEAKRCEIAGITSQNVPMYMDLQGRLHISAILPNDLEEGTIHTFATVQKREDRTDLTNLISEAYSFTFLDAEGRTHCYYVPQINCDSEDGRRINQEILKDYGEIARQVQAGELDGGKTSIAWTMVRTGQSRFALILFHKGQMDNNRCRVYNFDVQTGLQIGNVQLFAELGVSEEAALKKIKDRVREAYALRFADLKEKDPARYEDQLLWLISSLYIHPDMSLYLNARGELTAVVTFGNDVEELLVIGTFDPINTITP